MENTKISIMKQIKMGWVPGLGRCSRRGRWYPPPVDCIAPGQENVSLDKKPVLKAQGRLGRVL